MIRLGQGLYWHNRRSELGETADITIRDVDIRYSDTGIIANATLKNVLISGVRCSGKCRTAFTTFGAVWSAPGVKMENVTLENLSVESDHPDASVAEFPLCAEDQFIRDSLLVNATLLKNGTRTVIAREELNRGFDQALMDKYVKLSDAKTVAAHRFREEGGRVFLEPDIPTDRTPVDGVFLTKWGTLTTHVTYNLVFVATPCPTTVTCWGETHEVGSGCYYFCKNPPDYFW